MDIFVTYSELRGIIQQKFQQNFLFSYSDRKTVIIHHRMNITVEVSINEIIDGNTICMTYQTNPKFMKIIGDSWFKWINKYPDIIEKVGQTYVVHLDKIENEKLHDILNRAKLQDIHFDNDGMIAEFSIKQD